MGGQVDELDVNRIGISLHKPMNVAEMGSYYEMLRRDAIHISHALDISIMGTATTDIRVYIFSRRSNSSGLNHPNVGAV